MFKSNASENLTSFQPILGEGKEPLDSLLENDCVRNKSRILHWWWKFSAYHLSVHEKLHFSWQELHAKSIVETSTIKATSIPQQIMNKFAEPFWALTLINLCTHFWRTEHVTPNVFAAYIYLFIFFSGLFYFLLLVQQLACPLVCISSTCCLLCADILNSL